MAELKHNLDRMTCAPPTGVRTRRGLDHQHATRNVLMTRYLFIAVALCIATPAMADDVAAPTAEQLARAKTKIAQAMAKIAQPSHVQKTTVTEEPPTPSTQPVLRMPPPSRGAILPPAEYDHEYTGKLDIVKVLDGEQARAMCPDAFRNGGYPIACAQVRPNSCTIIITPEEIIKRHGYTLEAVLRHERAHCNGFRH
jgi:hypothetical protein